MEIESIKKIVETEKRADKIKLEAKEKATTLLENAKNSQEKNKNYFKGRLQQREKELQGEEEKENKKQIAKIQAETTEVLRKLNETVQVNMQKAVDEIFNKIIQI